MRLNPLQIGSDCNEAVEETETASEVSIPFKSGLTVMFKMSRQALLLSLNPLQIGSDCNGNTWAANTIKSVVPRFVDFLNIADRTKIELSTTLEPPLFG